MESPNNPSENQNESNEQGKPLMLSQATRGAKVSISQENISRYDTYAQKSRKKSHIALIIALLGIPFSIKLFMNGHWIIGVVSILITLIAIVAFFALRGMSLGIVYESGLLVPGVIVNVNPIQIVTLGNVSTSDDGSVTYACKKITTSELPLHQVQLNEKVPCAAMFGGPKNGIYTNFEPRPLSWATSDSGEITKNIDRIDDAEWQFLDSVKNDIPDMKDFQVALFTQDGAFDKVV